jgi:hypothetical protein
MTKFDSGTSKSTGHPYETRIYKTAADRRRAIKLLTRGSRFNHFVPYLDVAGIALTCGWAEWAVGQAYVCGGR